MRWDHLTRFTARSKKEFPGFKDFVSGGTQAEYLQSVFPAESFPAWQTITTGVYPDRHDIIGNQFYDPRLAPQHHDRSFFNHLDERMTEQPGWWSKEEPIWVTAAKQGLQFVTLLWARCDLTWFAVRSYSLGEDCENVYSKDDSKTLTINMETALIRFQEGKDAAIVSRKETFFLL